MSGITITLDDRAVIDALNSLASRMSDMTPVMIDIGEAVRASVDLNFRGEHAPDGTPWEPLSATTMERRRGDDAQILKDTGRLANSITYLASADGVDVGTDVIYAAVHQFGNPNNRFYNTPRGRPAPIPARPFMPDGKLEAGLADDVLRMITRYLDMD